VALPLAVEKFEVGGGDEKKRRKEVFSLVSKPQVEPIGLSVSEYTRVAGERAEILSH